MWCSERLHGLIKNYNCLNPLEKKIQEDYLSKNSTLCKVVFLVNHFFRAAGMAVFMAHLPCSYGVNLAICFGGSLFYRLTIERNCAYKFALPAFAGAVAFPFAYKAVAQLLSGVALSNLSLFATSMISLVPITAYLIYVVLTVDYDVNIQYGFL